MTKPKRKFEAEVITGPVLKLEKSAPKVNRISAQKPLQKRNPETSFTQELINGIIEKIKDL